MKHYLDEYLMPVETVAKCIKCETRLGCQDPGDTCSTCKFIMSNERTVKYGR